MRQLDNYEQVFDNDGNFLVGSLTFCDKGTTTPKTIYAWDSEHDSYVAINPVQFVSVDGRTATQIFLDDADYTIYVKKYIGSGDMATDTDPNNWVAQYSFNNLYDVISLTWTNNCGLGLFVFENLQDMKSTIAVDMYSESMVVALAGWTTKGDKPITYYHWDENCNETATDVEFVKPNWVTGAGRWVLVNDFASGFDVRNAGCFPTPTSAGDVSQTYGLQKANAYCVKYGLKMVIPHTLGSDPSCYVISNLILTAPTYVQDKARLYTNDSATLNLLTEDNNDRSNPFIFRDDTHTGSWSIGADVVETNWFANQATNKENWRPSISAFSRLVYNKKFDTTFDAGNDSFIFSNIIVDFLVNNFEKFELTECVVRHYAKVLNPCDFVRCDIGENVFDSDITYDEFALMGFSDCKSDFGNWNDPNKFVIYKAIQEEPTIDLQGQWCTIDLTDYGIPYCFKNIDNALFNHLEMPQHNGAYDAMLFMHNVKVTNLLINQSNTNLANWTCDDCDITLDDTSYGLLNCEVQFNNTRLNDSAGSLEVNGGTFRECRIDVGVITGTSVAICDCNILKNPKAKASAGDKTFKISFCDNVLADGVQLEMDLNGQSLCHVSESEFCDNVLSGTRRDLVNVVENGGTLDYTLDYVFAGNRNALRGEKFKNVVSAPYYAYSTSVPSGVDKYIKQIGVNLDTCELHGFSVSDFIVSLNDFNYELTRNDILVSAVPYSSGSRISIYDSDTTSHNDAVKVWSDVYVYKKGISSTREILKGDFGDSANQHDYIFVDHNAVTDQSDVYFVLNAEEL